MDDKIYLNGKLVSRDKAHISISDHGFLYGYGLFETMRAYNGKMFFLDRHIARLNAAARVIGMEDKLKGIDFVKICNETVAANKLKEARVRLTVTNGDGAAMPWIDPSGPPNIVATAQPYTPFPEEKYNAGFRVGIASPRRLKQSPFSAMKSVNYLINVVARMETAAKGYDETVLLNDAGYIAEGGGGNIFFVNGDKVVTPPADSGIIPGVTREAVMELAAAMGISVKEENIRPEALRDYDEVFMTNAIIEVMPVVAIADEQGRVITIGNGKPGKVALKLMEAYREKVRRETG